MSRNFQLLEKVGKDDWFLPAGAPIPIRPPLSSRALHKSVAEEEMVRLVQRLFLQGGKAGDPEVVSFAGMARDDRSSWLCASAAQSLAAQTDASVCLVDANFHSPRLHAHFQVGNKTGLATALVEDGPIRRFATPVAQRNLWLIPSGSPKNPLDANLDRLRARFTELRQEFDYVLVSASPLTHENEAILTSQLGDGIVLVIEANRTARKSVRTAQEHLSMAKVKLLGAVLDQRRFPIPEFLYRKL